MPCWGTPCWGTPCWGTNSDQAPICWEWHLPWMHGVGACCPLLLVTEPSLTTAVPMRPCVGFSPTTPHRLAGMRMLPPPSLPAGGEGNWVALNGGKRRGCMLGQQPGTGPLSAAWHLQPLTKPTQGKGAEACCYQRCAAAAAAAGVVGSAVRVAGGARRQVQPSGAQPCRKKERHVATAGWGASAALPATAFKQLPCITTTCITTGAGLASTASSPSATHPPISCSVAFPISRAPASSIACTPGRL